MRRSALSQIGVEIRPQAFVNSKPLWQPKVEVALRAKRRWAEALSGRPSQMNAQCHRVHSSDAGLYPA